MAQLKDEFLNEQEDNLRMDYPGNTFSGPGPDDDDFIDDDDDDDFDIETGDDIDDADLVTPEVLDDDDDDLLADDEDDEFLDDDEPQATTEADRITRSDMNSDFEVRPHHNNRGTGRMIDHEPGNSGFDPSL